MIAVYLAACLSHVMSIVNNFFRIFIVKLVSLCLSLRRSLASLLGRSVTMAHRVERVNDGIYVENGYD
jgi:hypothetical protein